MVQHTAILTTLSALQSVYRRRHSTETAVLKVIVDFLSAVDRCEVTFLILLHMSTAFDTVDHDILIDRLYHSFGLRDKALSWIVSFISGRTLKVLVGGQYSTSSVVYYGVPQGSALGPILFLADVPVTPAVVMLVFVPTPMTLNCFFSPARKTQPRRSHACRFVLMTLVSGCLQTN